MTTEYSLKDVALRNGKNGTDTWVVIKDKVYNVTPYLSDHPGTGALINEWAGKDATKVFNDFGHSADAHLLLKKFRVGQLVEPDKKENRDLCTWLPDGSAYCEIKKKKKLFKFLLCR